MERKSNKPMGAAEISKTMAKWQKESAGTDVEPAKSKSWIQVEIEESIVQQNIELKEENTALAVEIQNLQIIKSRQAQKIKDCEKLIEESAILVCEQQLKIDELEAEIVIMEKDAKYNDAMTALTNATETIRIKEKQIAELTRENQILKLALDIASRIVSAEYRHNLTDAESLAKTYISQARREYEQKQEANNE